MLGSKSALNAGFSCGLKGGTVWLWGLGQTVQTQAAEMHRGLRRWGVFHENFSQAEARWGGGWAAAVLPAAALALASGAPVAHRTYGDACSTRPSSQKLPHWLDAFGASRSGSPLSWT